MVSTFYTMQVTHDNLPQAVQSLLLKVEKIEALLADTPSNLVSQENDAWLDIDGLLKYIPGLGAKATIYKKTANHELPFHKRGKRLLFLKSEIDAWLQNGKRKSCTELRKEIESSNIIKG